MTEKTFEGLPIDLYIHRLKTEQEKWGNLANEPVARKAVLAIIEYFEEALANNDAAAARVIEDLERQRNEAQNNETLANRQRAAASARETKCKNELKACRDGA